MDNSKLKKPSRNRSSCLGIVWNILTILTLLAVVCVTSLTLMIYTQPYSALNPFPPPTLLPAIVLPTATSTSIVILPPTWTATNTVVATPTETPYPTATMPPTATVFTLAGLTPSPTRGPTATSTRPPSGYPFEVQKGGPVAIANIYHPDLGCNWMGVGGQVVDMSGSPVTGLIIRLGGALPGVTIPEHTISLTGVALSYGRAGFEFTLADHPIASKDSLWLQLLDQSNIPISEKVAFSTYENCEKNLIIVNFRQVR
jgi:hypothetical protein